MDQVSHKDSNHLKSAFLTFLTSCIRLKLDFHLSTAVTPETVSITSGDSLTGLIVCQRHFVNHIRSLHPGTLITGGELIRGVEDDVDQTVLLEFCM